MADEMVLAAVLNCRNRYSLRVAQRLHSDAPLGINSDLRRAQSEVLCPPALRDIFLAEGSPLAATRHQLAGITAASRCRRVQ